MRPPQRSWRAEIEAVIYSRGITDPDGYARLSRVDRRTPLHETHRAALWRQFQEYERRRIDARPNDWTDLLTQALDAVPGRRVRVAVDIGGRRRGPGPGMGRAAASARACRRPSGRADHGRRRPGADGAASPESMALAHLADLVRGGVERGDVAVLAPTNRDVEDWLRRLERAGITALCLADYDGRRVDAVKVGTYERARALEFAHDVIPRHSAAERTRQESEELHLERLLRERRRLYVAITRARDSVWLGSVDAGAPIRWGPGRRVQSVWDSHPPPRSPAGWPARPHR